jgi:hypothetical protein
MGKYVGCENDIFSIFASAAWEEEHVAIYPRSVEVEKGPPPYLLFTIVPSGPPLNAASSSGVLLVEIYTAWGLGPKPASELADTLDKYLQHKSVGRTQLFNSSLDRQERDKDNPSVARVIYSLPYSHFGVN